MKKQNENLTEKDLLKLIHELEVHQIELEKQNELLLIAKEKAEESEARFRNLMESIDTVAVQGYRPDGITQFWNKASEKLYGYTQQEAIGSNLLDLIIPSEMKDGVTNAMHEMAETGEPIPSGELLLKHKDGSQVPVISHHAIVKVPGHVQELFCVDVDITERKQAEMIAIKERAISDTIIESTPGTFYMLDENGRYVRWNAYQRDIIVGKPDSMLPYTSALDTIHPEDRDLIASRIENVLKNGVPETVEARVLLHGGPEFKWLLMTGRRIVIEEKPYLLGIGMDITERKLMEDVQAFLLQISNPGSDENFFKLLAKYLSQCLDMEYVCIDLLEGDGLTAKTLAIYNEGNYDPNVSYVLKDTPCGEVVGNQICCYPQGVRSLFPNDAALEDIKAESYIGTTLWSFDGQPIGLISVIGQKPLQNQELAASLLKLVSLRAAGKLEASLADEKVRESEEKFRVLIESTSVGIYLTDLNGKCTYVNPKWCEMARLSHDEALGEGWVNGIYVEDREKVFGDWEKMIASDGNWGFEYRFGTLDKLSWVFGTAKSYKNESGNIAGYMGSNVDVTERKQSEAIIRDIIEKNPMSIQILDMEGYPIQVNPAHTKLFGVETPADYSIFKDSQLLSLGFCELFERIKKGEVVYFPDTYYNVHDVDPSFPDSPAWVRALGFTLNDNNGKPNKIVLMHENITERKNAEALLNDIIENNPLSIQVVDKEGYSIRGNPAFIGLFGSVPPPEFSIFEDLKSKSTEMENLVSRVKNGEMVHLPDIYFNAHDAVGEAPDIPLWIRALLFPIKDSSGKPERFVLMHENITERKIAEQELIKAKEHAEESDRLKSAFLANMSHEIRTPMNGILGFSELLKEPGLTGEQQHEYIRIIEKSGARMLNIINDIVDISKIEAGLMKLDINKSNVNDQIEYIYTFFKPEVEAKGMKFTFRNSLIATEAFINTDREKLYAILTNLVKNAIKYTKNGSIEFGYSIEARHAADTKHALSLQFYVKDTGIGIPKDRQEAIFERFIQADIEDRMARQGAGLGLAITKAYIEMLGGKIWVESEEGIGSTFYFTLPYNTGQTAETIDHKLTPSEQNNNVRKLKVLIAEDDEVSAMLADSFIKIFCKEVLTARTGYDTVKACRENPDIDLVLMDIQMPEMGGCEATQQIRKFNKELIIIAQTAYGLSGDREKAIEAGCNDYLSKPISKDKLLALIHKYFKK